MCKVLHNNRGIFLLTLPANTSALLQMHTRGVDFKHHMISTFSVSDGELGLPILAAAPRLDVSFPTEVLF